MKSLMTRGGLALVLAGLALASCRVGYDVDATLGGGGSSAQLSDVAGSSGGDGGAMDSETSPAGATGDAPTAGADPGASGTGGSTGTAGTDSGGSTGTAGTDSGGSTGTAGTDSGGSTGTAGTGGASGAAGTAAGGSAACSVDCEPTGIVEMGEALTAAYGGDSGAVFSDRCPAGQVLVGFAGYADAKPGEQWLDRVQAVCGTLSLSGAGPYSVVVGPGLTLPMRGLSGNKKFSVSCPTDTMVIGFEGRSGLYFDQITMYCAPLEVSGSAGSYTLAIGAFTTAGPAGGDGGSAFARTDCPPGWVAYGAEGRSGDFIDKLGLACTEPSLAY